MSYDNNLEVIKKIQEQQRSRLADDLSKRILGSMEKSYLGPQTVNWLKNMKEDLPISGGQDADGSITSVAILDKLFDEFQRYAFQYNRNEPNRDYIITCKRPDARTPDKTYMGFLFNSRWAMLGKAVTETVILSFVAPRFAYEQSLGTAHAENDFRGVTAFLKFDGECIKDRMVWKIDNHAIGYQQLPTVAKSVFARFIRVTRGECSGMEPLSLDIFVEPTPAKGVEEPPDDAQASRLDMITDQILSILETLDDEIQEVENVGVMAVRSKQTDVSNKLLERSKALRRFRQRSSELALQWSAYLSGDFQNHSD